MPSSFRPDTELVEAIRKGAKFLVTAHVQPDGDALGAALALTHLLRALGKTVVTAIDFEIVPDKYSFLPGVELLEQPRKYEADTLICVDVANESRLGDNKLALETAITTINIDHHPDNSEFAAHNWIEPTASSASEMIFDLWAHLEIEPTVEAATCIYVGMLTDTGNWQYSNTTGRALRIAAELLDLGVEPNEIYARIYERNSVGWVRLMSLGLAGAVVEPENRLAYTVITQSDLSVSGAKPSEIENLVDSLRSLAGIDVAIVIKETTAGEFKGSARSHGHVDVGALARTFGGGGHHNAAGFTSHDSPSLIISKIKKLLRQASSE